MTRITASDVEAIYETDLPADSIQSHIDAATALVDDIESAGDLSTGRLETIETYVAAHFVSLQDPRVGDESIGSASWSYELDSTYMDVARQLDPTGTLDPNTDPPSIHTLDGRNIE